MKHPPEGSSFIHPMKGEEIGTAVNNRLTQCQDLHFLYIRGVEF